MKDQALPKLVPLNEQVYGIVRKAIVERKLEPGAELNESELASQLNVSRSPVRDTVQRLCKDGLVERKPNGRYRVAMLSTEDLEQLYIIRRVLEGLAAQLTCDRMTPSTLAAFEGLLRQEAAAAQAEDPTDLMDAGTRIHVFFAEHCGNPMLKELVLLLLDRVAPFTVRSATLPERASKVVAEHLELLDALRQRDSRRVREVMENHIEQSKLRLLVSY